MAEAQKSENSRVKMPEFLREPLVAAQARLEAIEGEAQRVLKDLVDRGRASRKDLEHMVQRLSKQEFSFLEVRHRLEKLRDQGAERAAEWRGRAESFRTEALERMFELQSRAVHFLGVATREQVEELSKEMERLAKRLDRTDKTDKAGRKTKKSKEEV